MERPFRAAAEPPLVACYRATALFPGLLYLIFILHYRAKILFLLFLFEVRDDRPPTRPDPDLPDQDNVSQMVRRVRVILFVCMSVFYCRGTDLLLFLCTFKLL